MHSHSSRFPVVPRRERTFFAGEAHHLACPQSALQWQRTMSSPRMTPTSRPSSSTGGLGSVFFKAPDDLLVVSDVLDLTVHDVRGLYFVIRENKIADGDDADKFFVLIGDIQIIDI